MSGPAAELLALLVVASACNDLRRAHSCGSVSCGTGTTGSSKMAGAISSSVSETGVHSCKPDSAPSRWNAQTPSLHPTYFVTALQPGVRQLGAKNHGAEPRRAGVRGDPRREGRRRTGLLAAWQGRRPERHTHGETHAAPVPTPRQRARSRSGQTTTATTPPTGGRSGSKGKAGGHPHPRQTTRVVPGDSRTSAAIATHSCERNALMTKTNPA
jgi:hypothetical protein